MYSAAVRARKNASAAAVSRALTDAGLVKSEYHASGRIRGWGQQTAGFEARAEKEISAGTEWKSEKTGRVLVEFLSSTSLNSRETIEERMVKRLLKAERAKAALEAKGYLVELSDLQEYAPPGVTRAADSLIVTKAVK